MTKDVKPPMSDQPPMRADDPGFGEIRAQTLGVRLAETAWERDAAQALRYRVFYDEMGAHPTAAMAAARRDFDDFDEAADHLLVIDHARGEGPEGVVGTYRLLRRAAATRVGRFYSASEYDITPLLGFDGQVLELGRSCVDAAYRTRGTLQLLWRGIAAYVFKHRIDLMFGCASLPGTDPDALAAPLSYLWHNHLAPPALRPRALPALHVPMDRLAAEAIDARAAIEALPPLIKGYLRVGAKVGDGAFVDRTFNTVDVFLVMPVERIVGRYGRKFGLVRD